MHEWSGGMPAVTAAPAARLALAALPRVVIAAWWPRTSPSGGTWCVLLYTDGLTEARHPRTRAFVSVQQIVDVLHARAAVGDAMTELRNQVLPWSGGALYDDIADVLLEYAPDTDEDSEMAARGAASSLG
jgi:hypothetical protein